jgi:putative molybdopterin biosynthesis protein
MTEFLSTREVAALLRLKERKVYELAKSGAIPVSRVTGKLLFPRALVEAWVLRNTEYREGLGALANRPLVLAGSHDPLLDWALRESGAGIATYFDGSLDGLARLARGAAIAAGMHVLEPETGGFNVAHLTAAMPGQPVALIEIAKREQGLVLPAGNPRRISSVAGLAGLRVIPRQPGAGSRILLDHLMAEAGLEAGDVSVLDPPARNQTDVALAVAEGRADAGMAVAAAARPLKLDFLPLFAERFDLAVWRRDYFEPPLQALFAFARTRAFADRAAALGGYDLSGFGTVHHNGP